MNLSGFDALMYCEKKPVVAVKNEKDCKMAVVGFSVHYSTFALTKEFPTSIQVKLPVTYSFEQTIYSGAKIKEYIHVHIPVAESNISEKGETLLAPERMHDDIEYFNDLMFYFAAAMVALLFAEWWLQSRENS